MTSNANGRSLAAPGEPAAPSLKIGRASTSKRAASSRSIGNTTHSINTVSYVLNPPTISKPEFVPKVLKVVSAITGAPVAKKRKQRSYQSEKTTSKQPLGVPKTSGAVLESTPNVDAVVTGAKGVADSSRSTRASAQKGLALLRQLQAKYAALGINVDKPGIDPSKRRRSESDVFGSEKSKSQQTSSGSSQSSVNLSLKKESDEEARQSKRPRLANGKSPSFGASETNWTVADLMRTPRLQNMVLVPKFRVKRHEESFYEHRLGLLAPSFEALFGHWFKCATPSSPGNN
ncbi:hypothetical protein OCU04_008158 [Sclerotinia nivalis]|uniref:Uncharacterized protein n=1 Tax=Sclerotinia nivalis TaxID=352851 RepID=A0A9X0DHS4_9HELO|nr:hypothetical protein OCU04_008158 [Sclerotinia nivalis]